MSSASTFPDFLLLTDSGPVVVDVKPSALAAHPRMAFTFVWTRRAVETRGWRYEVWNGAGHAEVDNVRLLAGYIPSEIQSAES